MSYSIFVASKFNAQIDFVQLIFNPHNTYQDANKEISLIAADDTELVKQELMELSDRTEVSFSIFTGDPFQSNDYDYYWYLQDDKYLSENMGLSKHLDAKTFNALEGPITNYSGDEYHFDFPLDTYSYKIFPFHLYDQPNLSKQVEIFAESEENINTFLLGLEEKGIIYTEHEPFVYEASFVQDLRIFLYQNPLLPLTIGLFFIVLFAAIYQDRRNLTIKLINGYSKAQYITEKIKYLVWVQNLLLTGSFLFYYFFTYAFNFTHFLPLLSYYVPVILLINLAVMILITVTVYSFTDINQTTYVQGIRPKGFTSYFIGFAKFLMGLLIIVSMIPSVFHIIQSVTVYQSLSQQMTKYEDIYTINSTGDYHLTLIDKSDEIIESLQDNDNIIYQSHFGGGSTEASAKVVRVNDNYMKRYPLIDENGNPIDPSKTNVVYTHAYNIEDVEYLKQFPEFLGISEGVEIEIVVLDDNAELTMFNMDPYTDNEHVSQDFILIPQRNNFFILGLFFVFENDDQIEQTRNQIADIVDTDSIYFNNVTERWEREISGYQSQIIENGIKLLNYLIIIVILSLIYYQIKLDKVRKEFSVYWVNGISKFHHFYADYLYQILLGGIMIMLIKTIGYPDLSMVLTLMIFLIYIAIDTLSFTIFRRRFYTQLQKHIKERV